MTNDRPTTPETPATPRPRRVAWIAGAVAAGAILGFAGVYGIGGRERNAGGDPACRAAVDTARRIAPLIHGDIAALTPAATGLRLPDVTFRDAAGQARTLSGWRGKTVLLNLWATWCVPCRKEMPALDALQDALGGDRFAVVAVNIDTRDPDKPRTWLKEAGIARLGYYHDEKAKIFQDLKAVGRAPGMPTSILIDAHGCEIAMLAGPAEWAGADALRP
jgi:thiol-disulfide isomerase/thioredoxin